MDRHPPSADQHVLAAFIADGYLDRHIRKCAASTPRNAGC